MNDSQRLRHEAARGLRRWHRAGFAMTVAVGIFCMVGAGIASAAEVSTGQLSMRHFPVGHIFTFLFLMLGPFKIIGPFAKITQGADASTTRQIALWATLFSSLALAVAAILGERAISSYGIPVPVLALAAGIILFLVALLPILEQAKLHEPHGEDASRPVAIPVMKVALAPLAFPTIVTPYGVATLVVFMALSPDLQGRLIIGAIGLAIMLLNLIVMLVTKRVLPVLGPVLAILGAVLGVVQVALGLQIINNSVRALLAM